MHWLGHSPDHILHGTTVHTTLARVLGDPIIRHTESPFVLDIWEKG